MIPMSRFTVPVRYLLRSKKSSDHILSAVFTSRRSFSTQSESRLEDVGPMASHLKSRSVICFRGPDTINFLQGLLTNDLRRLEEDPAFEGEAPSKNTSTKKVSIPTSNMPTASFRPLYAAMLNGHGRFLYDFFLYKPSKPDEKFDESGSGPGSKPNVLEILADVDSSVVDELVKVLKKYVPDSATQTPFFCVVGYRLGSKVEVENVDGEYRCWQLYGGNQSAGSIGWGGNVDQAAVTSSQGSSKGWQWYEDPRLHCLGFRGLFPSSIIPPLVEADNEAAEENYLLWRIEKGVAEGSAEIPKGEAMPLEYNLAGLNAISFDKGCYVGQELVARTHHRGVIRKRLLPLKFLSDKGEEIEQRVAPGSVIKNPSSGKKAGSVTTALGSRGLGLLRLEESFDKALEPLVIEGIEDVKVEAIRPDWWPAEWYLDNHNETSSAAT